MTLFVNYSAKSVGWQKHEFAVAVEYMFLLAVTLYGALLLLL